MRPLCSIRRGPGKWNRGLTLGLLPLRDSQRQEVSDMSDRSAAMLLAGMIAITVTIAISQGKRSFAFPCGSAAGTVARLDRHAMRLVTSHPVVGSWHLPARTFAPTARSASGWDAYGRRGAGMSIHPYLRATLRAPCCGGRRSRSPEPTMPCSRASNSHRPDLVSSLDYPMTSLCWLTQHVPPPVHHATGRMACRPRQRNRRGKTAPEGPFASNRW